MSHPTHTNYTLSMQRSLFLIPLASIPYIISHSYTKISQTRNQFPIHPLKTIRTVKMAWHYMEHALAHNEFDNLKGQCDLFNSERKRKCKKTWLLNFSPLTTAQQYNLQVLFFSSMNSVKCYTGMGTDFEKKTATCAATRQISLHPNTT